jgi:hypothetical protein
MLKKEIVDAMSWFLNTVSESIAYEKHWSSEFSMKKNKEAFEKVIEYVKPHIDWNNLDSSTAKKLGFKRWDEEHPDLFLIPLWLYDLVPIGTDVVDIFGKKYKWDATTDKDTRFGCLSCGIKIKV